MNYSELLKRIIQHVTTPMRFLGEYRYRVVEEVAGKVTLQPVSTEPGFPDQLSIAKSHGLQGSSEVCTMGSEVYVRFEGGSAGSPFISGYPGDWKPQSMGLDAVLPLAAGGGISLGSTPMFPIALGTQTASAILAINTYSAAVATFAGAVAVYANALVALGGPFIPTTPAANALATAAGTLSTAATGLNSALTVLTGNAPNGLKSIKVQAQ